MVKNILSNIYEHIVESNDDGIMIVDSNGIIRFCNYALTKLLMYEKHDLVDKHLNCLLPKNFHNIHETNRTNFIRNAKTRYMARSDKRDRKFKITKKNGSLFYATIKLDPITIDDEQLVVVTITDNTEEIRKDDVIEQFGKILDGSFDEIYVFDQDTLKFVQANRGAIVNTGYSIEELKQMTPVDLKTGYTLKEFKKLIAPLLDGERDSFTFETHHTRKDTTEYPVEVKLQTSTSDGQDYILAVVTDISERKYAEMVLRERENYLTTIVDTTPEYVGIMGENSVIFEINSTGLSMLGVKSKLDIQGFQFINFVHPSFHDGFMRVLQDALERDISSIFEFDLISAVFNRKIHAEMHIAPIHDANAHVITALTIIRDITERKRTELRIKELAYKDPLTSLYNRRTFDEKLKEQTAIYSRSYQPFALMVIDLDDFRMVNNSLGHQSGDELLKQISSRIRKQFRRETDFCARFGGDEFVVLLSGLRKKHESDEDIIQRCKTIGEKLVSKLALPYDLEDEKITITCSLGIAICLNSEKIVPKEILKRADDAMYQAKLAGKNNYFIHPIT